MILADKIIDLRKKAGWSQEELADKLGVSRQSVSKWEGAQSIPDMNKILQLSELFGVSTDYLLKDSMEAPEIVPAQDEEGEGLMEAFPLRVIARVRTDFPQKFGLPRQSGLVKELTQAGRRVLYVSGEESLAQIKMRASRMGSFTDSLLLFCDPSLEQSLVVELLLFRFELAELFLDSDDLQELVRLLFVVHLEELRQV